LGAFVFVRACVFAAVLIDGVFMWKLVLGFVVFAALAMYVLSKGDIDLGGEKHTVDSHEAPKK
jgi:hypothetical protein